MIPRLSVKRVSVVFVFIFCAVLFLTFKHNLVSKAEPKPAALLAPAITATNNDALVVDADGDGIADPGDTIEYTVTVTNGAAVGAGNDATGMIFNDTIDPNMTLVPGSVASSPIAGNDTFSVLGNVSISVPDGASDLLANDIDPDTLSNAGLTASGGTTSAQGGNVAINANGSFTYNPPPGFEGADTFTYTVSDAGGNTGTGTITFNVSGMVWFINNNAAACTTLAAGCGRLSNPFSTLAAFVALNNGAGNNPAANDNIFVFESATAYTGAVLLSGQKLIGQDATATLAAISGVTVPTFSTALPAMNTSAPATTFQGGGGTGVALNTNNTLRGFSIGNSTPGLSGTNFGTLTLNEVIVNSNSAAVVLNNGTANASFTSVTSTGGNVNVNLTTIAGTVNLGSGALSGATSFALLINQGAATVSYSGTITASGVARPAEITNKTGGTVTLSGLVSTSGTPNGVLLTGNTGATINFTGGLQLSTGINAAFTATGGGTISATQNNTTIVNALTTTSGAALNVQNTTIGASGLTFRSISSTGGTTPITLNTTGSSGGLTVTGNSSGLCGGSVNTATEPDTVSVPNTADCTGGTLQNSSNDAIVLTNTANVSLTRMLIQNGGQQGIQATNLGGSNFFRNSFITSMGIGGGADRNGIDIRNTNTNMTIFSVENSAFTNSDSGTSHIFSSARGTSSMRLDVLNSLFDDLVSLAVQSNAGDTEDGVHTVTTNITGNVFRNASPADGQGGVAVVNAEQLATHNFVISNNTFQDLIKGIAGGNTEILLAQTVGGALNGTISGNVLGNAAAGNGDRRAIGVIVEPDVSSNGELGSVDIIIENNTVNRLTDREAIFVDIREDTTNSELIIRNNNIGNLTGFLGQVGGIREAVDVQVRGETAKTLNLLMTGNNVRSNTTAPTGVVNLEVNNDATATAANIAFQATVTSNTLRADTGGIPTLTARTRSGDTGGNICLDMNGNTLNTGAGTTLQLNEDGGPINVEQASQAALATANGIPTGNVIITGTPQFGIGCATPPTLTEVSEDAQLSTVNFLEPNYQTPSEMSATIEPLANPKPVSTEEIAQTNTVETTDTNYLTKVSAFLGELKEKLGAAISPTVTAQETKDLPVNISGETIIVGAPGGFTLPASKAVTIKFRATIDNVSGLTQVSNQGTITGSNFANVLTDDPSVAGAANPTVTLVDRTTVAVTSSQNPSVVGQPVTFTANLAGSPVHASGNPTGTVQFFNGATPIGSPIAVTAGAVNTGSAQIIVSDLTAASHTITAQYSGGGQFNAGTGSLTGNPQVVSNTAVWDGSASANWDTAANWTTNFAPLSGNDVTIPTAGVTNNPTISATDISVNSLNEQSGRTLTVNSGRTLTVSGACTINGTLTVAGAFTCGSFSGTGTVNFTGAAAQNVPPLPYQNLTINNASGVNLSADTTVNGVLTLTSGNINAGANNLILGGTATVSRTSGHVIGNILKTFNAASSFAFPTGTANGFSPATVNVTAGTFPLSFNVRAVQGPQPLLSAANSLQRYWQVSPTGGNPTANLTFNYLQTDVAGTETSYRIVRINGTQIFSLAHNPPNVVIDTTNNIATVNGVTAFSDWTLGALVPTAANVNVSGRVVTAEGRAVFNAEVVMVGSNGQLKTARTNPFGYFRFSGIPAGENYTMSVKHKLYEFAPQVISITDEVSEIIFVASQD